LARAAEEDAHARALHQQALNEVVRATGRAKIPAVVEFLTDIMEEGVKMLVFAHHLEVLDAMEAAVKAFCSGGACAYMRIDGSTDQSKRTQMVNDFQQQDGIRVALLGITAMSTGVTLTAATTVVFAELHWTPGVMMQAEDRAHRIGQCCCVNVKYIVCKGTADDFMWTAFKRRLSVVSSVCNGDDTGVELQDVTEVTRRGGAAAGAAILDAQVPPACCAIVLELQVNVLQAQSFSSHASPGRKRPKSGSAPGPSASQPGIEMFMRQPPAAALSSSLGFNSLVFEAGTMENNAGNSSDDDMPMVVAAGARAGAAARVSTASLPGRPAPVTAPRPSLSSSAEASASTAGQVQSLIGSKRPSASAQSSSTCQSNHLPVAATSASGTAAAVVSGGDEQADVLDIDDLDSLFVL
jgi:hypothetical protein